MVNYEKIYDYLATKKYHITSAANIARFTDHERIYGATMSKLVREGWIEPTGVKGLYRVI